MSDEGYDVGETVAYDTAYGSEPNYTVSKIAKITPTGRITLENGVKFDKYGTHKITDFRHYYLRKYDDHVKDSIEKKKMLRDIGNINWRDLSNETLKKVLELVG